MASSANGYRRYRTAAPRSTRSCARYRNRRREEGPNRGVHRKQRDRSAWPGMMLHQDGSQHLWAVGQYWDLIVTMDDATNEHYSMFFCDEEGTQSSFHGVRDVIEGRGLFCSLYTDRGSHYWTTPAYSPEARGRSERVFSTHQDRLVKELALAGITDMEEANTYLAETCLPAYNAEFTQPPPEEGSAFVACRDLSVLDDILCEHFERTVRKDNCVLQNRTVLFVANRIFQVLTDGISNYPALIEPNGLSPLSLAAFCRSERQTGKLRFLLLPLFFSVYPCETRGAAC